MSTIYTFRRIEKKYIINHAQYKALIELLMGYFHKDEHGFTRIFNIYFDNDANELINTSVQKPVYKEKLRLRSYHTPDKEQDAFLEIKKKFKGVVYKRRITVPYKDIESFLATNTLQNNENPHTYKEINYMLKHYSLYPKVLISYLREAFFSNADPCTDGLYSGYGYSGGTDSVTITTNSIVSSNSGGMNNMGGDMNNMGGGMNDHELNHSFF